MGGRHCCREATEFNGGGPKRMGCSPRGSAPRSEHLCIFLVIASCLRWMVSQELSRLASARKESITLNVGIESEVCSKTKKVSRQ